MAGKCTIRMAAFVSVAGVVVPLAAQQVPVPTQPGPSAWAVCSRCATAP